jgi:dipeptidyl aminopeptidase/acylaminoacyl peptidase
MAVDTSSRQLTPETFVYGRASADQPALSPDGKTIAYSVSTPNQETGKSASHIWVVDISGDNPRQLSRSGERNVAPTWSPDGEQLAYVSVRDGDRPNCLVVIPIDGGESRVVAQFCVMPEGLAWSPSGDRLAYSMVPDPDDLEAEKKARERAPKIRVATTLDYKADGRGFLFEQQRQLHLVDVESGDVSVVTSGAEEHTAPQWSPDGKWIAVDRPTRAGVFSQIALIEVATGERRAIEMPKWMCGPRTWSPDGKSIVFTGGLSFGVQLGIHELDVATGQIREIAGDLPFYSDVFASRIGMIDPDTIFLSGFLRGSGGFWTVDRSAGTVKELAVADGMRLGFATNSEHQTVVQLSWAHDTFGELVAWDRKSGKWSPITHVNDAYRATFDPVRVERNSVDRGGETIEYFVTYPPNFDESERYPVVLHIHGGPHGFFWDGVDAFADVLASSGYVVVAPNPRGSGSYGKAFAERVLNDWGGEDWLDDQAALDAVLEHPWADAGRTGIMGYSYGGFMTSWAIGQTDRFRAAVCGAPVFNIVSFRGTSDISPDFYELEFPGEWPACKDNLEAHSPATFVHNAVTPTLVYVGDDDHRCPVGQAEELFAALLELGVPTELVRYPGWAHGSLGGEPHDYAVDLFSRTRDWFNRFI